MKKSNSGRQKTVGVAVKRRKLLAFILAQIPFEGWTDAAFTAGVSVSGVGLQQARVLFPHGIMDVVNVFGQEIDHDMQAHIAAERGFSNMRVRDKVGFAVRARFEALIPYREAMKRLLVWYAMPSHIAVGVQRIYRSTDLIWKAAGDTSNDYNFYTKRLLLAAVLEATMLYWLNDESPEFEATWKFLENRLSEVVRAGKAISLATEWTPSDLVEKVFDRLKRA